MAPRTAKESEAVAGGPFYEDHTGEDMSGELGSKAIADMGEALKEHAINEFLSKSTSTTGFVRNWVGANYPLDRTPRAEIEEAVRLYLGDTEGPKRTPRPAAVTLEFGSPIK